MHTLIEQHLAEIAEVCRHHGVKQLQLFGSAARGDFDPATSDFDFFVEFIDYKSPTIADQWFGIQEDLEKLLGRPVDLTSLRAVKNPYFLEVANRHKVTLYAA
ncbi:MAG TPA: nucleotidyltransferase domain-containing protein [Phycisphaerae bacterium]|nr:nucleotidyltransferase domain-containing protein [Phycisphaerae bacterium]